MRLRAIDQYGGQLSEENQARLTYLQTKKANTLMRRFDRSAEEIRIFGKKELVVRSDRQEAPQAQQFSVNPKNSQDYATIQSKPLVTPNPEVEKVEEVNYTEDKNPSLDRVTTVPTPPAEQLESQVNRNNNRSTEKIESPQIESPANEDRENKTPEITASNETSSLITTDNNSTEDPTAKSQDIAITDSDRTTAPIEPAAIDADSPGQILEQLKNPPPVQAVSTYAQAQAASAAALDKQRKQVIETIPEIPAPTGLPAREVTQEDRTAQTKTPSTPSLKESPDAEIQNQTEDRPSPKQDIPVSEITPAPPPNPTLLAGSETPEAESQNPALNSSTQNAFQNVLIQAQHNIQTQSENIALEEQEDLMQAKSQPQWSNNKTDTEDLESKLNNTKGGGSPLPETTKGFMESRFGADFSDVRVHNDNTAASMTTSLFAQAFTQGTDIYFNTGKYNPNSNEGKSLLAHELTHVVQQRGDELAAKTDLKIQKQEKSEEKKEEVNPILQFLNYVWGTIIGDWNNEQDPLQILVNTGVGLVPIADQVLDLRDFTAHLYYMVFQKDYKDPMRWLALALTAVGAIPFVGSIVKGLGKIALFSDAAKGIGKFAEPLLQQIRQINPEWADLGKLRAAIDQNWDAGVATSKLVWMDLLATTKDKIGLVPLPPDFVLGAGKLTQLKHDFINTISEIQKLSPQMIDDALERIRSEVDNILERLAGAVAGRNAQIPELATANNVPVPKDSDFSNIRPLEARKNKGQGGDNRNRGQRGSRKKPQFERVDGLDRLDLPLKGDYNEIDVSIVPISKNNNTGEYQPGDPSTILTTGLPPGKKSGEFSYQNKAGETGFVTNLATTDPENFKFFRPSKHQEAGDFVVVDLHNLKTITDQINQRNRKVTKRIKVWVVELKPKGQARRGIQEQLGNAQYSARQAIDALKQIYGKDVLKYVQIDTMKGGYNEVQSEILKLRD